MCRHPQTLTLDHALEEGSAGAIANETSPDDVVFSVTVLQFVASLVDIEAFRLRSDLR